MAHKEHPKSGKASMRDRGMRYVGRAVKGAASSSVVPVFAAVLHSVAFLSSLLMMATDTRIAARNGYQTDYLATLSPGALAAISTAVGAQGKSGLGSQGVEAWITFALEDDGFV